MTTPTPHHGAGADYSRSVFTGADVCREAGLTLPAEARRPVFEDDLWDFTAVIGLPTQMAPAHRRFDFTTIANVGWRLVAKELILALLAPRHDAVAPLPRACRTPLHLNSANGRLAELVRWLNWLTHHGYRSLSEVDDNGCEAYLAHRRHIRDDNGASIGERSPATRRAATQTVVDLINLSGVVQRRPRPRRPASVGRRGAFGGRADEVWP